MSLFLINNFPAEYLSSIKPHTPDTEEYRTMVNAVLSKATSLSEVGSSSSIFLEKFAKAVNNLDVDSYFSFMLAKGSNLIPPLFRAVKGTYPEMEPDDYILLLFGLNSHTGKSAFHATEKGHGGGHISNMVAESNDPSNIITLVSNLSGFLILNTLLPKGIVISGTMGKVNFNDTKPGIFVNAFYYFEGTPNSLSCITGVYDTQETNEVCCMLEWAVDAALSLSGVGCPDAVLQDERGYFEAVASIVSDDTEFYKMCKTFDEVNDAISHVRSSGVQLS